MIQPNQEDFDLGNELLGKPISTQGAYNIGVVTCLVLDAGWHPDRELLTNVATAVSLDFAIALFRAWLRVKHP